jgi:hypothetical protein
VPRDTSFLGMSFRSFLLERRGVLGEHDAYDAFSDESPVLAGMTAASVRGMIATGDRAGLPVRRVLSDPAAAE